MFDHKVFSHAELKELAINLSIPKCGNRESLVMRISKSEQPMAQIMLKTLFDKCQKEKLEKKDRQKKKPKSAGIMSRGDKFSDKFIADYNLKYVKAETDSDGNMTHHYVFKSTKNAFATGTSAPNKTTAYSVTSI